MISPSQKQVMQALEMFIRERFQVSPDDDNFNADTDLWNEGYVDSLGIVEIIHFLEATYRVSIPGDMLFDPDFVHIGGMARLTSELGFGPSAAEKAAYVHSSG